MSKQRDAAIAQTLANLKAGVKKLTKQVYLNYQARLERHGIDQVQAEAQMTVDGQ